MNKGDLRVKAASIFLKAADYIRQYGWQSSGMNEDGMPRCSMGALKSAGPKEKWDEDMAKLMYQHLYKELNGLSLTQFNYKYKSGEKVAQLFERTAHSLAATPHIVQK